MDKSLIFQSILVIANIFALILLGYTLSTFFYYGKPAYLIRMDVQSLFVTVVMVADAINAIKARKKNV